MARKRKTQGKGIVEDVKKFVQKGLAEDKPEPPSTFYQDIKKLAKTTNEGLKKSKVISKLATKFNPELGAFIASKGYGGLRQRGDGWWEDSWGNVNKFLKDSKILSTVGNVVLPAAGGALAGLVTANPLAAAAGGALGTSANQWLKSQGYGYSTKPLMLGSGYTYAYNGIYQPIPKTQIGTGGTAYGMVASEFGRIQG